MMRCFLLIILYCINQEAVAQNQLLKNKELSFSIGSIDYSIKKINNVSDLDFMNFDNSDPAFADYIIVKFGYKFDFLSKISTDIKLIFMDDLIPDNYDVSVRYFVRPWVGIGLGSMLYKSWLGNFEQHHINNITDYNLLDQNYKHWIIYDLGFYLSPTLKPINNNTLKLQMSCDLGVSTFLKNESAFLHKKNFSNEKIQYHYQSKIEYQPYIQPKIEICLKMLKLKRALIGFLFNSSYFYSKRKLNYNRSIATWTSDNKTTEEVTLPKHNYSRLEVNLGLFYKW